LRRNVNTICGLVLFSKHQKKYEEFFAGFIISFEILANCKIIL